MLWKFRENPFRLRFGTSRPYVHCEPRIAYDMCFLKTYKRFAPLKPFISLCIPVIRRLAHAIHHVSPLDEAGNEMLTFTIPYTEYRDCLLFLLLTLAHIHAQTPWTVTGVCLTEEWCSYLDKRGSVEWIPFSSGPQPVFQLQRAIIIQCNESKILFDHMVYVHPVSMESFPWTTYFQCESVSQKPPLSRSWCRTHLTKILRFFGHLVTLCKQNVPLPCVLLDLCCQYVHLDDYKEHWQHVHLDDCMQH